MIGTDILRSPRDHGRGPIRSISVASRDGGWVLVHICFPMPNCPVAAKNAPGCVGGARNISWPPPANHELRNEILIELMRGHRENRRDNGAAVATKDPESSRPFALTGRTPARWRIDVTSDPGPLRAPIATDVSRRRR